MLLAVSGHACRRPQKDSGQYGNSHGSQAFPQPTHATNHGSDPTECGLGSSYESLMPPRALLLHYVLTGAVLAAPDIGHQVPP